MAITVKSIIYARDVLGHVVDDLVKKSSFIYRAVYSST